MKAKIIGLGSYTPGKPIGNSELKKLASLEFDEKKLEERLGIKQRYMAKFTTKESTADFATKAAMNAISQARIDPRDIDLFVVATDTPEFISPSTATIVQGRIQEGECDSGAFDINASCASFAKAFDVVCKLVQNDPDIQLAVVTGVYNMPNFAKEGDVFAHTIFADGAGSFVIQKSHLPNDRSDYLKGHYLTDGTQWNYVGIYGGAGKNPISEDLLKSKNYGLELLQKLPGDRNIRLWPIVIEKLLRKANFALKDVDHFFFTQINKSVIEEVMKILGRPMNDTTCIMDEFGYTGSACLPMAFQRAVNNKVINRGDHILFVASGAGLSVGANLFQY